MKKKIISILILLVAIITVIAIPAWAWYTSNGGYDFVKVDYLDVSGRKDSTFTLRFGETTLSSTSTKLLAVTPSKGVYSGKAPIDNSYFLADSNWTTNEWYKSNSGATASLASLASLVSSSSNSVANVIALDGVIGTESSSGQTSLSSNNDEDSQNADNRIDFSDEFSFNHSLNEGDFSAAQNRSQSVDLSNEADNKIALLGGFGNANNKMIGLTINVSPLNSQSAFDRAAVSAVRYAIFYNTVTYVGGHPINSDKTVFVNNAFTYFDGENSQQAVSQNHCFQYQKNTVVRFTALVWIDGFADSRAEAGAFNFTASVHDYANISASNIPMASTGLNSDFKIASCSSFNRSNVVIPEALYQADGMTISRIVEIGDQAFKGNVSIESVTIPDSVKTIGEEAFANCPLLEKAVIGNGVTKIGYCAFANSTALSSVELRNPFDWLYRLNDSQIGLDTLSFEEVAQKLLSGNADSFGNAVALENTCEWYKAE